MLFRTTRYWIFSERVCISWDLASSIYPISSLSKIPDLVQSYSHPHPASTTSDTTTNNTLLPRKEYQDRLEPPLSVSVRYTSPAWSSLLLSSHPTGYGSSTHLDQLDAFQHIRCSDLRRKQRGTPEDETGYRYIRGIHTPGGHFHLHTRTLRLGGRATEWAATCFSCHCTSRCHSTSRCRLLVPRTAISGFSKGTRGSSTLSPELHSPDVHDSHSLNFPGCPLPACVDLALCFFWRAPLAPVPSPCPCGLHTPWQCTSVHGDTHLHSPLPRLPLPLRIVIPS